MNFLRENENLFKNYLFIICRRINPSAILYIIHRAEGFFFTVLEQKSPNLPKLNLTPKSHYPPPPDHRPTTTIALPLSSLTHPLSAIIASREPPRHLSLQIDGKRTLYRSPFFFTLPHSISHSIYIYISWQRCRAPPRCPTATAPISIALHHRSRRRRWANSLSLSPLDLSPPSFFSSIFFFGKCSPPFEQGSYSFDPGRLHRSNHPVNLPFNCQFTVSMYSILLNWFVL